MQFQSLLLSTGPRQRFRDTRIKSGVRMPRFAPVSKGKDAVRAVQRLAKLTPGEGGPGGVYPARFKSAIISAIQSRKYLELSRAHRK